MTQDDLLFGDEPVRARRENGAQHVPSDREVPLSVTEESMPDALDAWLGAALARRRREAAPLELASRVMAAIAQLPA